MSNHSHFNSKSRPSKPIHNDQSLESQRQKLEHLALRVATATEPPISEIQATFQTYLSSDTLPADKAIPSAKDARAVQLALLASGILSACRFHSVEGSNSVLGSCLLEAWPGIWKWLQFLDEQCCQRTKFGDMVKSHALLVIPWIIHNITRPEAVRQQTASMPAMACMKTKYAEMTRHPNHKEVACLAVNTASLDSRNVRHHETEQPLGRAESDVPADANNQAVTPVKMLDDLLAGRSFDLEAARKCISNVSEMVKLASSVPQRKRAMLDQGIVSSTVKTLMWLEKNSSVVSAHQDMASRCVRMCYGVLLDVLVTEFIYSEIRWIVQALDAGLLLAIMKSESAPRTSGAIGRSISFRCSHLLRVFALQLVYKSVVRSAAKALAAVGGLSLTITSESPLFAAWDQFERLSRQRTALKKRMEQDLCGHKCNLPNVRLSFRSLHVKHAKHVQCSVRVMRVELLRCGGCLSATYCSKPCQRAHWAAHKARCKEDRGMTQSEQHISTRPHALTFFCSF